MLRQPAFLRLWLANAASGLATWGLPFILGLAVIEKLISSQELGILLGARTVGFLLGVIYGGTASDRYGHRITVFSSALAAAIAGVVLTLSIGNVAWISLIAATIMGIGQGACRPAFQALIPLIVQEDQRQQANAYMTIAVRATTLLGPAITAGLAQVFSTRWLILIMAIAWALCALLPTWVSSPRPETTRSYFLELIDGLAEAKKHRWFIAGLGALIPVIGLGYAATSVVLPGISDNVYGSSLALTAALTAYTLGALVGAFFLTKRTFVNEGWVSLIGLSCTALAPLVLALTPPLWVIIIAYATAGIGIELFNVPWFTATQREIPPEKLGRVSSVDFVVSYGLSPLGLALYPLAIETFGQTHVLIFAFIACFFSPLLAMLVPGARYYSEPRTKKNNT
ncbi:arabinose efflux permease family protein [Corynebacterium kutscheri]|uniref:Arabinose efflux permease family protein n=1 Tax=Corynebacterium kutscheri TaxID=35755 RepID=A0A0F6TDK2_9CORY|nr:MFS transporter [Corynebacterium kutscheri]AKE41681.1 arabinose efflux permease family protein [Corynebacterium kutscheri]VEH10008.1 permease of the major facilitator superfamily [Corynebacterium kutscheri]